MNKFKLTLITALMVLAGCGGGGTESTAMPPISSIKASVVAPAKKATTVTGGNAVVIHMYQALYGMAPSNALLVDYAFQANNDASTFVKNLTDRFATTSHADLAKLVLDNLGVTAISVPAINASGQSEYAILLDAVQQIFAVYPTMRGQVILNMTNLLGLLETDATYGAAAIKYNDQASTNLAYSADSTHISSAALASSSQFSAAYANVPIYLPDLRTEYQTVCGTVSPFHVGVQSATVLNMAGHKDGKKDLIFTLWCGQQPGTIYSGPTKNGAVFFEQTNTGQFINVTRPRFGIDLVDVGGVAAKQPLVYDFNHDGLDDVVWAVSGEDGRLEKWGGYGGAIGDNFFLMSSASGQYTYQFQGSPSQGYPSYSATVVPLENELGGIDAVIGGFGHTPAAWRYTSNWQQLSGYDWVGPYSIFMKRQLGEVASTNALQLGNTTVNLRRRSGPTSDWSLMDTYRFTSRLQIPWISWQNSQDMVSLLTLDGRDYVATNFEGGCEIAPKPGSKSIALTVFAAYQLDQNYVSGSVKEGVGMSSVINLIAFELVTDKLQRMDLQVVGWDKSAVFFAMKCGDLNGDGYDDFAIFPGWGGAAAKPLIFLNDGNGNFSLVDRNIFPDPPPFYSVTTATFEDVDGDGIRDLIYRPLAVDFTKFGSNPVQFVIYRGRRPLAVKDLK